MKLLDACPATPEVVRSPREDGSLTGQRCRDQRLVERCIQVVRVRTARISGVVTVVDVGLVDLRQRADRRVRTEVDVDAERRHRSVARVQLAIGQQRVERADWIERPVGVLVRGTVDVRERPEIRIAVLVRCSLAVVDRVDRVCGRSADAIGVLTMTLGRQVVVVDVPPHRRRARAVASGERVVDCEVLCQPRPVVRQRHDRVLVRGEVVPERERALDLDPDLAGEEAVESVPFHPFHPRPGSG